MTRPLGTKNRVSSNKKRLIENHGQFVDGWAGVGIIVGIWAVTLGIIASEYYRYKIDKMR